MNQTATTGIVLVRREFGEADRILTVLTPDHGKVQLIAKGVRRSGSKLAGGIELFSVSNMTYLQGRGAFNTLVSSRLIDHYGDIVKDINRTMLGYDLLKLFHKSSEDVVGEEYFNMLRETFEGLNRLELDLRIVELWFYQQMLKLSGHTANLRSDAAGNELEVGTQYLFDFERMAFSPHHNGQYSAHHIKFMRLGFSVVAPAILQQVQGADKLIQDCLQLTKTMLKSYVRI